MSPRLMLLVLIVAVGALAALGGSLSRYSTPVHMPAEAIKDISQAGSVEQTPSQSDSTAELPPFQYEIVTTPEAHRQGLSGRAEVSSNYGMLFVFQDAQRRGFWMKDMLVPIDIVWLSDTGVIIGIERSVSPASYPALFFPPRPVRFVLETAAGESARLGWSVGTDLTLPLPYE